MRSYPRIGLRANIDHCLGERLGTRSLRKEKRESNVSVVYCIIFHAAFYALQTRDLASSDCGHYRKGEMQERERGKQEAYASSS